MSGPLSILSPAKLNLFLHITRRRNDGYHELQTLFQLLDWGDQIVITPNQSGTITLESDDQGIPRHENLIIRAAQLLQSGHWVLILRCTSAYPPGPGSAVGAPMEPPPCWHSTTFGT